MTQDDEAMRREGFAARAKTHRPRARRQASPFTDSELRPRKAAEAPWPQFATLTEPTDITVSFPLSSVSVWPLPSRHENWIAPSDASVVAPCQVR